MTALRILWWRFLHGQLMDRSATLDQLAHEALAESSQCMADAAALERRINLVERRASLRGVA